MALQYFERTIAFAGGSLTAYGYVDPRGSAKDRRLVSGILSALERYEAAPDGRGPDVPEEIAGEQGHQRREPVRPGDPVDLDVDAAHGDDEEVADAGEASPAVGEEALEDAAAGRLRCDDTVEFVRGSV